VSDLHPREVLRGLEQRARRRFGQNFLVDGNLARRIVASARLKAGDRVVEVGPGLGMLTDALLETGAEVTAIELDRDLASYLRVRVPSVRLIEGDAMKVNWPELCPGGGWQVVANLPFNVGTPLVAGLMLRRDLFRRLTVMLQHEVVGRLTAEPRTKAYGALTVRVRARCKVRRILEVPSSAFHPQPKVKAAVVRLDLLENPRVGAAGGRAFDRLVRSAFSARRKKLVNSLGPVYGRDAARAAVTGLDLPENVRAEALGVDAFVALAAVLEPSP